MKTDEKNERWQEEFDQMKALLHKLRGEEIDIFRSFIERVLFLKEKIMSRFDPKESCISVKLDIFGLDDRLNCCGSCFWRMKGYGTPT